MVVPPEARAAVLAWFDARGRALPFRGSRDPYAILVSEAMAQQTQVARAAAAWMAFMAAFPTVGVLAAASPADVLRAWRGLGYNRRATNLRRAVIAIVAEHGGRVPRDIAALERLPGVGPYTARAVAALAFGAPVGPVDTNVRRVLTRLFDAGPHVASARALQATADAAASSGERPGDWTHALMDIGATTCRPRDPRCEACPARPWCAFARRAVPAGARPVGARPAGARAVARQAHPGPRPAAGPFPSTSRWLRGRILDALRDGADDGWVHLAAPLGRHDEAAVRASLSRLAAEGLAELHPSEPHVARLPLS